MKSLLLLAMLFTLITPQIATAQLVGTDISAGDNCSAYNSGDTALTADSDLDQRGVVLICDGSAWQEMLEPSSIMLETIIDRDSDTFINVDNSNDDVIRLFSANREIVNMGASGANDSFVRILTDSSTANAGFTLTPNTVNSGYIGLGTGSPILNIGARSTLNTVLKTQGVERMRIDPAANRIILNQATPFFVFDVNGDIRARRLVDSSLDTSYIDMETADRTVVRLDNNLNYLDLNGSAQTISIGNTGDFNTPDEIEIGVDDNIWVERDNSTGRRIGIMTSTPDVALDVAGTIKLGSQNVACDSALEGGIRWNTTDNCIQVCDGIAWECSLENSCTDELPDEWTFNDVTNAAANTAIESNIIQVTGIDPLCLAQVRATGNGNPEIRICNDASCSVVDLTWTSQLTTMQNNKYLQVRATSPNAGLVTQFTSLRIGARSMNWLVQTAGDCTDPNPVPGTICADGTVFIGRTTDGFEKMYTTRCRQPRLFQGGACRGYQFRVPWNDYSDNYTNAVGASSFFQGQRNTTDLVNTDSNTNPEAREPYRYMAAEYCDKLGDLNEPSAYGYTDWYLPSQDEGDDLCTIMRPLGYDWNTIWLSTEASSDRARYERSDCYSGSGGKRTVYSLLCVRKESTVGTDINPDAFNFTNQTNVTISSLTTSDTITISGTDAASLVTLSGAGNPEMSFNGGTSWVTTGTINVDGNITVRLTSSNNPSTTSSATITIGSTSTTWDVTTGP
ncbi:MAG: hypothetical protein AB8B83_03550 [Bdellovibrionales bacterium]